MPRIGTTDENNSNTQEIWKKKPKILNKTPTKDFSTVPYTLEKFEDF